MAKPNRSARAARRSKARGGAVRRPKPAPARQPEVSNPPAGDIVAAFEPFGGRARNRSWELVESLPTSTRRARVRLPVDFKRLRTEIPELIEAGPRALLLLGEAPIREVHVEQVALNLLDSTRPDNAGRCPRAEPLVSGAPLALSASWDARALADALQAEKIPAAASFHAGTYACNAALYLALHVSAQRIPVGFLHVPNRGWPHGVRADGLRRAVEMALLALKSSPLEVIA